MTSKHENGGKFALGALIGAIAGATLGVLFAPRSGKETRKIIKDKAVDYKEKGEELARGTAEKAKSTFDQIKERGQEAVETVEEKFHKEDENR